MKAGRVMTKNVTCIPPELSLERAWALMRHLEVRHLPVTVEGRLVGVLSDRDLLLSANRSPTSEPRFPTLPAGQVMTLNPVSCAPGAKVCTIAKTMVEKHIDSMPIVGLEQHLVGLVTSTDLLELLTEPDQSDAMPFSFSLRTEPLS